MKAFAAASAVAVFCIFTPGAKAADFGYPSTAAEVVPGGWTIIVAPYLWAAGLEGDVGVGGRTAHIDESFGDIIADFDIGFMGVTEVRYNRFAVFSDLTYARLSSTDRTPFGILANKISTTSTSLMWTAAAEYRLVDTPRSNLDFLAGFRLFSIGNELAFKGGPLGGVSADKTETWADPIVGLKGNVDLTVRLYLTAWAMIGGFGVSSDSVWDVMGGAGYRFNEKISTVLGYRAAGVEYEKDGFTYDTVQHGLFTGIVFRF